MSDDNQIVRMAAAVFYDEAELSDAVRKLVELGIAEAAISQWGGGMPEALVAGGAGPSPEIVERATEHLAHGASIILVQAPDTKLHDKAVSTLLSCSHYPVHAEESGR
jgi:hypothetical protein